MPVGTRGDVPPHPLYFEQLVVKIVIAPTQYFQSYYVCAYPIFDTFLPAFTLKFREFFLTVGLNQSVLKETKVFPFSRSSQNVLAFLPLFLLYYIYAWPN